MSLFGCRRVSCAAAAHLYTHPQLTLSPRKTAAVLEKTNYQTGRYDKKKTEREAFPSFVSALLPAGQWVGVQMHCGSLRIEGAVVRSDEESNRGQRTHLPLTRLPWTPC